MCPRVVDVSDKCHALSDFILDAGKILSCPRGCNACHHSCIVHDGEICLEKEGRVDASSSSLNFL